MLLGAEFGGLDVGVWLLRDEDGGNLAVSQVEVVVERERCLLTHSLLILNYILWANSSISLDHKKLITRGREVSVSFWWVWIQ
jgi:hypothetical protein